MPTVSIILPTYNRAGFVQAAIQSALAQTYTDYELIVVDDGSTDETVNQVRAIVDSRLIYVAHNQNKGAAAARNTGMRMAQGDYIAFLDSDDTWHPQKLEQQVEFLENNSGLGGCVTSYRLVFDDHSVIREIAMEPSFYQQSLKGCNLSPGSTLLFKKECLEKVGYQNESLKRFEDWEWQIRFARFYEWQRVPVVLADIRAGHTVNFETVKQALSYFQTIITTLPNNDQKTIKMAIFYELFYASWKNRLWGCACGYLAKSFLQMPHGCVGFMVSLLRRKVKERSKAGRVCVEK
ncbi:glycosyltransferase family 2 protein [Candidatus Finniella inopinata]|uniref:Glycosyltransferase family 2 protein n=1 Tax=Candidatus Finniella inopinata TaxID=1696036 RepID=A0A4Q7DL75_9PROT|nr:glycosyltransferase family 2 protein [Candidatus Finniella inopinata]RZI47099.1 glycosyltransferase family 2 protein [Candidatus Finniella inopinata]